MKLKIIIVILLGFLASALEANAGIYRHFVKPLAIEAGQKVIIPVVKVVTHPIRHPKKDSAAVGRAVRKVAY